MQGSSFCILDIHIFLVPNSLSKSPLSKWKKYDKKLVNVFFFFFRRYFRMSSERSDHLLALVKPLIKKKDINLRKSISVEERLLRKYLRIPEKGFGY